jgi:hypothetical protein
VFCRKNNCTLSAKQCILRQEIALRKKREGENLTTFSKCFKCSIGKKVSKHPNIIILDKDIRKIMMEKQYRPKKHILKIRYEKVPKYKLKIKEKN